MNNSWNIIGAGITKDLSTWIDFDYICFSSAASASLTHLHWPGWPSIQSLSSMTGPLVRTCRTSPCLYISFSDVAHLIKGDLVNWRGRLMALLLSFSWSVVGLSIHYCPAWSIILFVEYHEGTSRRLIHRPFPGFYDAYHPIRMVPELDLRESYCMKQFCVIFKYHCCYWLNLAHSAEPLTFLTIQRSPPHFQ